MKYFLHYAASLALSLYFTDIGSDDTLFNLIAPVGIGVFTFLMIVWLALKAESGQSSVAANGSSHLSSSTGDNGCDGGSGIDC